MSNYTRTDNRSCGVMIPNVKCFGSDRQYVQKRSGEQ